MTDKDPKDMTVSELLRCAAGTKKQGGWCGPVRKLAHLVGFSDLLVSELNDNDLVGLSCKNIADKIDAEIVKAYSEKLDTCAMRWAKANGWPDFKPGEDFGAWLERCAIPRPRFEDGEPVQFGELVNSNLVGAVKVSAIEFTEDGTYVKDEPDGDWSTSLEVTTNRLKRPAPEVLGADGKPIVVGETVYRLSDGEHLEVLMPHGSTPETFDLVDCCGELERPSNLTHERPVQGADGLPVKVGETVWLEKDGRKGIVKGIGVNGSSTAYVEWEDGRWSPGVLCDHLTHTPPDTQNAIDDDATMEPWVYCASYAIDLGDDPDRETATRAMIADLLRRQREYDKRTGGDA